MYVCKSAQAIRMHLRPSIAVVEILMPLSTLSERDYYIGMLLIESKLTTLGSLFPDSERQPFQPLRKANNQQISLLT